MKEYAGPLVNHPNYEIPTRILVRLTTETEEETEILGKIMSWPGKETTNGIKSQHQTTNRSHLTRKNQRSTETPSTIYTIKEIVYANRRRDQPSETIEDVKGTAAEEIRYVVADPLQNGPAVSQTQSRSKMVSCKNRPIDW